jgi:hypothetical protein
MSSHMEEMAKRVMEMNGTLKRDLDQQGEVQWETERPLRHTSSRAPAPDWQRSVASLWDEVSRFEGLEEALCTPGEERFVVFTQRECTVEEHSHHRTVGDVRRIRR